MILFYKTTTADLYDVSRLVLSPIVTRPAALQLHNNNTEFVWWGGWLLTNYQVHSQLMLRLSWAVTIKIYCLSMFLKFCKEQKSFDPVVRLTIFKVEGVPK